MNTLIKRLPVFAFVLAAFAAFAFTPKVAVDQYGNDGTQWINVTGVMPGSSTYTCDSADEIHCLYDAPNGNPLSSSEDQEFVNRGIAPLK